MKNLLVVLFLSIPFIAQSEKVPDLKKIINVNKTEVHYIYKGNGVNRTVIYTLKNEVTFTKIFKNKKLEFELKSQKGSLSYKSPVLKKYSPLTSKTWRKLSDELKHFIESHKIHQSTFNRPMKGSNSPKLDTGIAQTWSNEDAINSGNQASDDDCTQTGSCSCGEETRTVTCPCMRMIHCESKTVTRCDRDEAGNEINCREVTGCMASCL